MIEIFVEKLARETVSADCVNQYAFNRTRDNAVRRYNLQVYLEATERLRPKTILVFEAPGYRGTRITGVPLTSQKIVQTHPFYQSLELRPIAHKLNEKIGGEASATIVQATLDQLPQRPLLWNSYPFHPHKAGLPQSNRKPRRSETEVGGRYLVELIEMFSIEQVVAVGNSAETTLQRLGISHAKIRHPSHGGKREFQAGLFALFGGQNNSTKQRISRET